MKSALIIDDERLARSELKKLLQEFPEVEVVGEAANAKEGIEKVNKLDPDLLFLDIQMPDKTGFELLEDIENTPQVISTTAYDEYAIKAFDFNALDYLMKPIEPQRLGEAINRLDEEVPYKESEKVDTVASNFMLNSEDQVFVKDGNHYYFIKVGDIRLFESAGNYVRVYFEDKKPLTLKSLHALEERLDTRMFFRTNRKYIVNLRKVKNIDPYYNGGLLLEIEGGEKVDVSRRQAVKFKELMSL